MPEILEQLLKLKLIELSECKRPKEMEEETSIPSSFDHPRVQKSTKPNSALVKKNEL